MSKIEWISRFRELAKCGLIEAKGALDANPGKTPEEVWKSCGGRVPIAESTLLSLIMDYYIEHQERKGECNCNLCLTAADILGE